MRAASGRLCSLCQPRLSLRRRISCAGALQQHIFSLERVTGSKTDADKSLWDSGAFNAAVHPDLPLATGLRQLLLLKREDYNRALQLRVPHPEAIHVQTVAAQVKSKRKICRQMELAASIACKDGRPGALLLLSGSHPVRQWLKWTRSCKDSFDLLHIAHRLRDAGTIPPQTGIWAVENPLVNPAARLQQKIDAGAEVVLTQPPLLWQAFEDWMDAAYRANMTSHTRLVIGIPMITSTNSLRFWLALCNATHAPGAESLVQDFEQHQQHGKASLERFCSTWTSQLLSKVAQLDGIAGLHIMPVTARGRAQASQLIQQQKLPRSWQLPDSS